MKKEFKKGDLVRVVNVKDTTELAKGDIHVVSGWVFGINKHKFITLYKWNRTCISNGFHPWRFKKVKAGELTPNEIYEYTKFKLKGK